MKNRKPQLADSIERLDAMVDGLATAIPSAVADAVRDALGPMLVAAIKDAVAVAVKDAVKQAMAEATVKPVPTPVIAETPKPAAPSKPGIWAKVKAGLRELKTWAAKKAAPVVARVAFGWAVMKVIGGATIRNKTAGLVTALTGFLGFAAGEIGSAVMLGLSAGVMAACAMWMGPMVGLVVGGREE